MQSSSRPARDSLVEGPKHPRIEGQKTEEVVGQVTQERGWFLGLIGRFAPKASQQHADTGANALLAFPSEVIARPAPIADAGKRATPKVSHPASTPIRPMVMGGIIALVAGLSVLAIQRWPILRGTAREPRSGNLTISTRPSDSEVLIDGARRGTTPLTLSLTPGAHTITVRRGGDERIVPLTIASGAEVSQYFEMRVIEPAAVVGRVSVVTDPPGARIAIDGKARGVSPITVTDLTAGDHKVTVTSDTGSAERAVTVASGGTASVMFSLPKVSGPVGGWLSISAPFDIEVVEHDDVIGTGGTSRIMLAAGRHEVTLLNRSLGYQDVRRVDVTAGKTMSIRVDPPKVSVSVNARPWAEVTLDGSSVGQTPIANLLVAVGPHEMVFRHPQLGERRQNIVVTARGPNRIAADLSK